MSKNGLLETKFDNPVGVSTPVHMGMANSPASYWLSSSDRILNRLIAIAASLSPARVWPVSVPSTPLPRQNMSKPVTTVTRVRLSAQIAMPGERGTCCRRRLFRPGWDRTVSSTTEPADSSAGSVACSDYSAVSEPECRGTLELNQVASTVVLATRG